MTPVRDERSTVQRNRIVVMPDRSDLEVVIMIHPAVGRHERRVGEIPVMRNRTQVSMFLVRPGGRGRIWSKAKRLNQEQS